MKYFTIFLYIIWSLTSYSQTLTIGCSNYNPPFESWVNKDNQEYAYGYDIDFMSEICRRLNYVCTFKPYEFDNLFQALKSRKIDLAISAIIVTKSRQEQFAFTLPYLGSSAQYITNANSPLEKLDDIHGKKVGARKRTPYGSLAQSVTKDNTLVTFDSVEDVFIGLKNNDVDVCIMDYQSALSWMATNPGVYKLIGKQIPIGDGYAIMLNLDQRALKEELNRVILNMEEDGTFLKIYSQYF